MILMLMKMMDHTVALGCTDQHHDTSDANTDDESCIAVALGETAFTMIRCCI